MQYNIFVDPAPSIYTTPWLGLLLWTMLADDIDIVPVSNSKQLPEVT